MTANKLGTTIAETLLCDPAVTLPADIQASIARGEEAFKNQSRSEGARVPHGSGPIPNIITSVIDQSVQDRRDINLDARAQPTKGNRRQPPMINRLRAVMIVVDRLMSDGMPFGVGPNSKMNKAVRNWLNAKAERSPDTRKSRRTQITPTAVRALLKQVRAQGGPVVRTVSPRKRTTQEEARERLRELRARSS